MYFGLSTSDLLANASTRWTTTKGETTTTAVTCPAGITCGIAIKPQLVKITGQVRKTSNLACPNNPWNDFEVVSVKVEDTRNSEATGKDGSDNADVTFFACLHDCEDEEACKKAKDDEGMELCPGTTAPDDW